MFVEISYQARFCLQISYPAIWFTMLMWFFNCGSFIVHALLPGTSKVFTLSVFLPGARIHIFLPGMQHYLRLGLWWACVLLKSNHIQWVKDTKLIFLPFSFICMTFCTILNQFTTVWFGLMHSTYNVYPSLRYLVHLLDQSLQYLIILSLFKILLFQMCQIIIVHLFSFVKV